MKINEIDLGMIKTQKRNVERSKSCRKKNTHTILPLICLEHSDHLSSHDYTNMHSKNMGASKDGTHQLHGSTTMTLAGRGGSWGGDGALAFRWI